MRIIKRDGIELSFDSRRIAEAIKRAMEAEKEIDQKIDALDLLAMTPEECEEAREELIERKQEIHQYWKSLVYDMNDWIHALWLKRNAGAGRSNTSAVSDMMLLTVPTPPTAKAAYRSLWQRGIIDGAAA